MPSKEVVVSHNGKLTVALAISLVVGVGTVAMAAGGVIERLDTVAEEVQAQRVEFQQKSKEQAAALMDLNIKVVRMEESLKISNYSRPSK